MQRERARANGPGLSQLAALLSLLMLCLGCQIAYPQTCANCGSGLPLQASAVSDDRFPIFEFAVPAGTFTSAAIPRRGPNLIVEAFMTQPGTATVTVLEAPRGGQLITATDSAANARSISSTQRWMVKGVLADVAVQITVSSGQFAIYGAWNQQPSDRGQYYDRNAKVQNFEYNAGSVAPHAFTQRWSYTVPAGRKAFLEAISMWIDRKTAAGPAGTMGCEIRYTPSGASMTRIVFWSQVDNTVESPKISNVTNYGYMGAGDTVSGNTLDLSTGGVVDFNINMKATEFDV